MKVVSVINYKGGVGKTTVTANIATELAKDGKRVLIIDLDPQASLTFSFINVDEWESKYKDTRTIKNWYDDILNNRPVELSNYIIKDLEVNKQLSTKLSLIPSHLGLFDVEVELAHGITGGRKRKLVTNKLKTLSLLAKGIERLKGIYDIVIIDCQPSFNLITQSAIVASDNYMIPTRLDYLSTLGVTSLDKHINGLLTELNDGIEEFNLRDYHIKAKPLGVVSIMVQFYGKELISTNKQYYNELQKNNIILFKNKIRENKTFFNTNNRIPVVMKRGNSDSERDILNDLKGITIEFIQRVGL
ncbi:AAA family ATPase [Clostridium sp.]|uniref:ParA family protein n=1 Tax=Clostridium sp. TaxID=1506 RepID=UPI002FC689BF